MAKFKIKRCADSDFTESRLPHNRTEVFFDCIRLRWREFLKLGVIILLSMLPMLMIGILRDNLIADAIYNDKNLGSAGAILLLADGLSIPFYFLVALALSGAFRIIKNIAWGDFVFFGADFKDGVRLNFKIFSPTLLLVGIGIFLVDFTMLQSGTEILKGIPLGLSILLLMPIAILIIVQGTIYSFSFFGAFKNALYLFSKWIIPSVIASIVTLSPTAFSIISNTAVKHICLAFYLLRVLPYLCLGLFLSGCAVLDKYHNSIYHPEIVGKGITPLQEELSDEDEDISDCENPSDEE